MPENQQEATTAIHKGTEGYVWRLTHTQKGVGMEDFSVTHIGVFIKLRSIYQKKNMAIPVAETVTSPTFLLQSGFL